MIDRTYRPYFILLTTLFAAILSVAAHAQSIPNAPTPTPPSSIQFMGETFSLGWESHPTPKHQLYEYFPPNQKRPRYHTMLLLDRVTNGLMVPEAVQQKMEFLKQRAGKDPVVNFDLFKQKGNGEFILNFLVSDDIEGVGYFIEWGAYRYIPIPEGGILIGYSTRAYNVEESREFSTRLIETKQQINEALASLPVPQFSYHASKR